MITLVNMAMHHQPILALAPMDGITNAITRELLTQLNTDADGLSAVGLCASEFVRVTQAPIPQKVLLREVPELKRDGCTPCGVPVFVQLLGGDPAPMAETARRAAELGARGIDINFGCPAKTVNRHDGGAALLKCPERMTAITAAMRQVLPDHVPLSVKIRTGWDSPAQVEILAQAAERGGATFLTVHGRTRLEMYKPAANMDAIARARAAVSIPVIANGDLLSPLAIASCAAKTHCDAFMIGRGAMAEPNLFLQVARHATPFDERRYAEFLLTYVERMIDATGSDIHALGRLKSWLCLASRVSPERQVLFDSLKRAATLSQAVALLNPNQVSVSTIRARIGSHELDAQQPIAGS